MATPEYSPDDIEVIDGLNAVRRRPAMFVGPLDDPAAINTLLTESLCIALDNAITGCATAITITMHDDGSATVRDDGPGFDVEISHNGMTTIEILLTQLHACRKAKQTLVNETLCGIGIFATNALSKSLVVETVQHGWLWRQDYSCGKATGPIRKIEPAAEQWQQITFQPDPDIFGSSRLSSDYFSDWFLGKQFDLRSATVNLCHGTTSTQLYPYPENAS
ncbi:MAG: hypothetical protein R3C28_33620 [Pirellulaceae bacterium]